MTDPVLSSPEGATMEEYRSACTHPEFDAWWDGFGKNLGGLNRWHLAMAAWTVAWDHQGQALASLRARIETLEEELKTIRKLAFIESVEDALRYPAENETSFRLRAFQALAALRLDLRVASVEPRVVQAACDAAVTNLQRAEAAEQALETKERDVVEHIAGHWFTQGGCAEFGDLGSPSNADELVSALLALLRGRVSSGAQE